MKLYWGCITVAAVSLAAATAHAQVPSPYPIGVSPSDVSDIGGPYAELPPPYPAPRYGPVLLPPREVYAIARESGFAPLGIPRQRGLVYIVGVINRDGDDGRLVIDARSGRIVRFMPAYRMGDNSSDELTGEYGPVGPLPPPGDFRRAPRPPEPVPHFASRTPSVPLPKAVPHPVAAPKPLAAKPAAPAVQRTASTQIKASEAKAAIPTSPVEAKPTVPQILPTQEMPAAQGLE